MRKNYSPKKLIWCVLKLYLRTDAGEDKLQQVQHTGPGVGPAQVLENQVRAKISRLKLSPDGKFANYSQSIFIFTIFNLPIAELEVFPDKVTMT